MRTLINLTSAIIICLVLLSCGNNNAKTSAVGTSSNNTVATSGSGDDIYIEMAGNTTSKQMQIQSLTKMYLSANGKLRHEMTMTVNGKPSLPIVSIGNINNLNESTELDDSAKTYTVNRIDTSDSKADMHQKFTVNKIGNEKIADFNCVHAQIISTTSYNNVASMFNRTDTTDLWMSPDVPMPDAAKKYMNVMAEKMGRALGNGDVAKQLTQMGCVGFPVKFLVHGKEISSTSQITKINKDNFPSSLFEIPAGYKKTAD